MPEDEDGVIVYRGCAKPGDTNFADVRCRDDEIVEYLEQPSPPLSLTDAQLAEVIRAAAAIPTGRRDAWLRELAGRLDCEPSDDEVRQALRIR